MEGDDETDKVKIVLEFIGGPFLNSSQFKYQTDFVLEFTAGTHWIWSTGYDIFQFGMWIFAWQNHI